RSRQPFLDAVYKLARGPLRNQLQREPRDRVFGREPPEAVRIITIVDQIAVDDEVLLVAGAQRVLEPNVADGSLREGATNEEIAVAFDIVNLDAGVPQTAKAIEHGADRGRVELRIGDEVVKQIAVEVERARLKAGQAVDPLDDRPLAAGRETDV